MDPAELRADMVDGLVHRTGGPLEDAALERAMLAVPRHRFLADGQDPYAECAHERLGTRVLAPGTVARLVHALELRPGHSTLIVGAGVGYTAAVTAEIAGETNVHAVDIARPVVHEARRNLARSGYGGVLVDCRDGARGLPEYAPFDRILVEAAVADVPRALVDQLAGGGRVVYPRAGRPQRLESRTAGGAVEDHGGIVVGPLLVEGEQSGAVERNRTEREDREHAKRRDRASSGWERQWIEWDERPGRRP